MRSAWQVVAGRRDEQHLDALVGMELAVIAVAFGVMEVAGAQEPSLDDERAADYLALLRSAVAMGGVE